MGITLVVGTVKGEVSMPSEGKVDRLIVSCSSIVVHFFFIFPRFILLMYLLFFKKVNIVCMLCEMYVN